MKILSTFEIDTILSYSKSLKAKAFSPSKCNLIWILRLLNLLSTSAVYFPSSNLYLLCGPWNLKLYRFEALSLTAQYFQFVQIFSFRDYRVQRMSNSHFEVRLESINFKLNSSFCNVSTTSLGNMMQNCSVRTIKNPFAPYFDLSRENPLPFYLLR